MKFNFPTPYTVLMGVIIIAAAATWILPSGQYSTIVYDQNSASFEISSATEEQELVGTQSTIDELGTRNEN